MKKKRVLCFGDSNTHGYNPVGPRYDETVRWPCVMARILGDEWSVIEEGFNGRTCVYDDPIEGGYKSGLAYLPPCLMSHAPLDAIVLMLGTNDTKERFGLNAVTIANGMEQLINTVRSYGRDRCGRSPRILLVAPVPISEDILQLGGACFGPKAPAVSAGLAEQYGRLAALAGCDFLDAAEYARVSDVDGVHLTPEAHRSLAAGIARKLTDMLALHEEAMV